MLTDLLSFALSTAPDKLAVVCDETAYTFGQVHARANALAAYFKAQGVSAGERIGLLARNVPQYLETQVACLRAGAVLVPLNFRLAAAEVQYILRDCSPRITLAEPAFAALVDSTLTDALLIDAEYERIVGGAVESPPPMVDPDVDAMILYTSGTTGRPKGAVLTNRALYSRIYANLFEYSVRSGSTFLQCLPMFHIASNVSYTYSFAGATCIYLKDFHPLAVLELIEKHQVTTALLVPTMINALIHQPETRTANLSTLERVAYGASPIPPSVLVEAIHQLGCEFLQLYGMTETSAATVLRPQFHDPRHHADLLTSAGQSALGMDVRIVDDSDNELADGDVGEIVCRGEAVMRAYWNNREASDDVLKNGWMHTGDLGFRSDGGFFFVTDRKKDMIVSGGENVYPREVEDVLFEHPGILEAAVIGVPDDKWGERVHACIVMEPGQDFDADDIRAHARASLAGYKVPRSLEAMHSLPKNATGKVLKVDLRRPYWEGQTRGIS